ncbi:PEP-CTERM sorting domain-containing protein [[Empedobacter] haloabium]|uniref:PEP-CTERM sorting domain-containing protein n=1 Tax=[Empedobacter] haloabium TaxID=592317 RepID=A0ABZ1UGM1_9BURK
MKFAITAACVAALLAGTSASAATPTSASISIANAAIHVFDLTPDDGNAAGYSIQKVYTGLNIYLNQDEGAGVMASASPTGAATIARDSHMMQASAGWTGTLGEITLTTSSGNSAGYSSADAWHAFTIRVAPHTAFAFTALVTVADGRNTPGSFSKVGVWLDVLGLVNPQHDIRYELERGSWDPASGNATPDFSLQQDFSVSYVNLTDSAQDLSFTYRLFSDVRYAVAPVPEPATYLMLGVGLLAIGAQAARRHRAA